MTYTLVSAARVCAGPCACLSRRRLTIIVFAFAGGVLTVTLLASTNIRLPREDAMEEKIATINLHLEFLQTQYRARQEDLQMLQKRLPRPSKGGNASQHLLYRGAGRGFTTTTHSPEVIALFKNMSGMKSADGLLPENLKKLRMPFANHIWPHLLDDPYCLKPAYRMTGGRLFANVVIGIPTVKRDKENYLMVTLQSLLDGLRVEEKNETLIVVFVGETDLEYVMNVARNIEIRFPTEVKNGLIEVISPSPSYYPDLDNHLQPNLGDSFKRVKWRTKQNLDSIYLMAYSQPKAAFYLMLEDDVIAKRNYMQDIKSFIGSVSISHPNWIFIDFCGIGGIGKLIKSSHLLHFVTYLQLFYSKMPIDWLLESYLNNQVCPMDKSGKKCTILKVAVKPKYKSALFQHIGLYSSLKGKIHKIKDAQFGVAETFHPHKNPSANKVTTDIKHHGSHDLKSAYEGLTFFWGIQPKAGNLVEFWFEKPLHLESYIIRTGNIQHVSDKFYDSVIQVQPANGNQTFVDVGWFDEFGLAEGSLRDLGLLNALRIKVTIDSSYWVVISEIHLRPYEEES